MKRLYIFRVSQKKYSHFQCTSYIWEISSVPRGVFSTPTIYLFSIQGVPKMVLRFPWYRIHMETYGEYHQYRRRCLVLSQFTCSVYRVSQKSTPVSIEHDTYGEYHQYCGKCLVLSQITGSVVRVSHKENMISTMGLLRSQGVPKK